MHEVTQRRICRFLFVVLCLIPTLGTTTWALMRQTSFAARQRRTEWESRANGALHLSAGTLTVKRVENPHPRRFVLRGVQLADRRRAFQVGPRLFVSLPTVHVSRELEWQQLSIPEATVEATGLRQLADRLGVAFRNGDTYGTRVHVRELTLERSGKPALVLHSVQWLSSRKEQSLGGKLSFQLVPEGPRVEIRVVHDFARHSVGCQLNTFQASIPCWLLEGALPVARHLGADAEFRGSITSSHHGKQQVHVQGEFSSVDLKRLMASMPGSFSVEGRATVKLDLEWTDGQLARATAGIFCASVEGNGPVGRIHTFLVRGAERLGLRAQSFLYPAHVDFSALSIQLRYEAGKVVVEGGPDGVLLHSPANRPPLLSTARPVTVRIDRAVDILFSEETPRMSVSRRSWDALRWFDVR